ncbi:hypothetical protein ABRP77_07725 [Pectobacterium odoriferum]|uniref:hypothetical protein n=1 Tax=Pectobacterium odoriferum TaxID=78398 RepID=UPI0032ECDC6E
MNTLTNERLKELSVMHGADSGILDEAIKETAEMAREILSLRAQLATSIKRESAARKGFDEQLERANAAEAQLAELRGQNVTNAIRAFVTDEDIKALNRFAECCDDPESGGHDLEQEQVMRLEKIGALQRHGRISYITDFGDLVISLNAHPVPPAASQHVPGEPDYWVYDTKFGLDISREKPEHEESVEPYFPVFKAVPVASQPYTVPDGWVLVPIEPTWEMLSEDGCKEHHKGQECLHHDNRRRIWRAMLSAAPRHKGE